MHVLSEALPQYMLRHSPGTPPHGHGMDVRCKLCYVVVNIDRRPVL